MKQFYLSLLLISSGFALAQSPEIIRTGPSVCSAGSCTTYQLQYPEIRATTGYDVSELPYEMSYPQTGAGVTQLPVAEDSWSPEISLPFPFCFYGQPYHSLLIGSNGLITFETDFFSMLPCPWDFSNEIPYSSFPVTNAIYGVYQSNTSNTIASPGQSINYFVSGTAPNRVFVVNFYQLPSYQCPDQLQTSQIVLHETTNLIDIFVENRSACLEWNNPNGLIGVQNPQGTLATVPADRNTGAWSAQNEAWRFSPNGDPTAIVTWNFEGQPLGGSGYITDLCPEGAGVLSATITSSGCGVPVMQQIDYEIFFGTMEMGEPEDLYGCSDMGIANFDLSSNDILILAGQEATHYEISYHRSMTDAEENTNALMPVYSGTDGEIIYARVYSTLSGCVMVSLFALHVGTPQIAPIGATTQDFTAGQTLADLNVTGIAIQWYADEALTQPLTPDTLLQDGLTYYALETYVAPGCQNQTGRQAVDSNVLAVTVNIVLSVAEYQAGHLALYPNPARSQVHLKASENIHNVTLYSLSGQILLQKSSDSAVESIDLSGLSNGIYLVKASGAAGSYTARLVKK